MSTIILASASPRRCELLKYICDDFSVQAADIDETPQAQESPKALVHRLAIEKAKKVLSTNKNAIVIGADTLIAIDGKALGKPSSQSDFLAMMEQLAGRSHQVLTSVACVSAEQSLDLVISTDIEFAPLTKAQALAYWQTGEPQDKAGGYAIQGLGAQFVKRINGSYSAVVGLPLYETKQMLETLS
jgi:septum formation protein